MKLCKDCKYFIEASDKEVFCSHDAAVKYDDPIYGNHSTRTCQEMRTDQDPYRCGKIGRLWTAKPGFQKDDLIHG